MSELNPTPEKELPVGEPQVAATEAVTEEDEIAMDDWASARSQRNSKR